MWSRTGPALVELDKEEWVLEGPPVDDSLHQVDEGHNHEADEEEGDEGPQVVPSDHEPIAQATEPTLMPGVGGVTRGVRGWSAIVVLIVRVGRRLTGDTEHIHEFQGEISSRPFSLRLFALTCRQLQDSCGSRTTRKNLLIMHGVTPGGVPNLGLLVLTSVNPVRTCAVFLKPTTVLPQILRATL